MPKKVDLCLVNASLEKSVFPPLSLAYLSSYLKEKGKEPSILDLSVSQSLFKNAFLIEMIGRSFTLDKTLAVRSPEEEKKKNVLISLFKAWKDRVLAEKPDMVGFTVNHRNLQPSLLLAHLLKTENPHMLIVFGGPECSMNEPMEMISSTGAVDLAVQGEGEITLLELIEALEQKKSFASIEGLITFRKGAMKRNASRPAIPDLDVLPFPDFGDFHLDRYKSVLPVAMSRGCVGVCTFCNERVFWGKKYRYRSPTSVAAEMLRRTELGITHFRFNDSLVNGNTHLLKRMCELLIEKCAAVQWYGNARAEGLPLDLLKTMKKAGCYELRYGVESPVPHILQDIRKRVTPQQIEIVLKNTKSAGITSKIDIICSFPTETKKDFIYSLRWLFKNRDLFDQVLLNQFILSSSTEMFQYPERFHMVYTSLYDGSDISMVGAYRWESTNVHGITALFRYTVLTLFVAGMGKPFSSNIPVSRYEDFSLYILDRIQNSREGDSYERIYDEIFNQYKKVMN